jgi:SAM-dependent methyltransferase
MREFFELFCLNQAVKKYLFIEHLKVIWKFYRNPRFFIVDSLLRSFYFLNSPFKISKRFLLKKGESDIYTFGETPLTTLQHIAREASIESGDVLYDLGCGTGRTSFWFHFFAGCKVIGIEYVPTFVKCAERVRKWREIDRVEFILEDMLKINFANATVVYLYGSCFEEPFLESLIQRLKGLKAGSKIVTVSYPLSDYCEEPLFEVIKQFTAKFAWGEADVYIQTR